MRDSWVPPVGGFRAVARATGLRRIRVVAGVLLLASLASLAAGCGSGESAAPAVAPQPAPAEASEPSPDDPAPSPQPAEPPAPAETPVPQPAVEPLPPSSEVEPGASLSPPEPEAESPPTEEPAPADPRDAYFALDRVLDIAIQIEPSDWDELRYQTRTFEDLLAEIEEFQLSRPFASIYSWFPATVTVDGETHTEVGVRKKGFLGSQSETKPALKLRFDKYVDDQALGGVIERMTLNNSVQDPSMINTCLTLQVFAAAGSPASRCNFATVSVNGRNLGLYVHVEELKAPFLARHFASAEGNLYEGTVSDFTPEYRGTIEKKTNEKADDWSDIDAVVAALADPSPAGLEALAAIVDLDRFLSYWATEVLVGHWDGYAGNRNNYQFYREPDGRFVFIPWGTDATFHLEDDPNPFDDISNPPPSVLALTAIPNRLYQDTEWRARYVERLKYLLETVWDSQQLLASVDEMAAIVWEYSLPAVRPQAAADAERVRQFILKRRAEILEDLTPQPPDWPTPESADFPERAELEIRFETRWGSSSDDDQLTERSVIYLSDFGYTYFPYPTAFVPSRGTVLYLSIDGSEVPTDGLVAVAGYADAEEKAVLGIDEAASISIFGVQPDGSVEGLLFVLPLAQMTSGTTAVIGSDQFGGGVWTIPAGASTPNSYTPLTEGTLTLTEAGTAGGATILGSFVGVFG